MTIEAFGTEQANDQNDTNLPAFLYSHKAEIKQNFLMYNGSQ